MSSHDATCSYTHELASGTWECPHESVDGERCPFHRPVAEKDDAEVARAFRERTGERGRDRKELVGAVFGDLDLAFARLDAEDNYPLTLLDAEVRGDLTLTSAAVTQPFVVDGLTVRGDVAAENATFSREVTARDVTVDGRTDFQGVTLSDRVRFDGTRFRGPANFHAAAFDEAASFDRARFEGPADFASSTFGATASFEATDFEAAADLEGIEVAGEAGFVDATAAAELDLRDALFRGNVRFGDPAATLAGLEGGARVADRNRDAFDFEGILEHVRERSDRGTATEDVSRDPRFGGVADFRDAEFEEEVVLAGVTFEEPPRLTSATFRDPLSIVAPATGGREMTLDLTDARVAGGRLDQPDEGRIVYDLTGATVGNVDVGGGDRSPLEHCRFLHTTFDGFEFGDYRDSLAANDFRIHSVAGTPEGGRSDAVEPTAGDLEATYLKAKNGADAGGDNRAAAEFYRKELTFRRHGHADRVTGGDGPRERLTAAGQWTANLLHDLSCGYGERPSRVVFFALAVILGFAPVYALIHPTPPYESMPVFGYVVVSFESFATLIHGGGPALDSPLFRFVTEIEAFFGAFISGLFVFALTRSINR